MKKRHRITCSGFFVLSRIGHLVKIYEKIKQEMAEHTCSGYDILVLWGKRAGQLLLAVKKEEGN